LLHKQFHATRVRGKQLVFHLRERWEKTVLSPAHSARTPEIPGFPGAPVPIHTPEPPPPSAKEARRRFWSVHVENFVADPVSEIWIELYRFQGAARVAGGFYLHPHVQARIGPATVSFLTGDLTLGVEETLLRSMKGESECVIDPYAPDEVQGDAIWPKISGEI